LAGGLPASMSPGELPGVVGERFSQVGVVPEWVGAGELAFESPVVRARLLELELGLGGRHGLVRF
jgi:hypothetical protein